MKGWTLDTSKSSSTNFSTSSILSCFGRPNIIFNKKRQALTEKVHKPSIANTGLELFWDHMFRIKLCLRHSLLSYRNDKTHIWQQKNNTRADVEVARKYPRILSGHVHEDNEALPFSSDNFIALMYKSNTSSGSRAMEMLKKLVTP